MSLPPPLPPRPVPYASGNFHPFPSPDRPPAVLGTIGAFSVLVGILSILASGWTGHFWWAAYRDSTPSKAAIAPPLPLPPALYGPYRGETTRSTGLPAAVRGPVVTQTVFKFNTDEHRKDLDALLANFGRVVFPSNPAPLLFDETPRGSNLPKRIEDSFTFQGGCTIFLPASSVQADYAHSYSVLNAAIQRPASDGPPFGWSVIAIDADLKKARAQHPRLTDMQLGFMDAKLSEMVPKWSQSYTTPITGVDVRPSGNAVLYLTGTQYVVLPDGRAMVYDANIVDVDPATGVPQTAEMSRRFMPEWPGSPGLMLSLAIYCGVVILAAMLLITAGLLISRGAWIGVKLHFVFIALKLALIVTEVLLSFAFFLTVDAPSQVPSSRHFNVAAGRTGVYQTVVAQLIYPLILISVLVMRPTVRDYFRRQTEEP